ncbi:hypothetical protein JEQ12_010539 [Ovis aries]|uniref:Mucin catalytic TM and cytoplasmic tail domain-containing protein n=1 Tax=Ovis aries TaxID=9940 RepID=A0A835ZMY2_SHEEP|nr:hypothetical protein JEQ12_010539 [Ovis aries]
MKEKVFSLDCWLLFHLLLLLGNAVTSTANTTTTSLGSATTSSGTDTTATSVTISSVTSSSTAPPREEEKPSGHLRPGEVVLVTLASVAMAVILLTGLLFYFRNSPSLRNLFNVDLLLPPLLCPHGCYEVPEGSRATVTDFRGELSSPGARGLTGRQAWP